MPLTINKKIVICGATGNQGGAVAAVLLRQREFSVIALTRDPCSAAAGILADQGAAIRKADVQDMRSLLDAFSGAHGVFGVTQPWQYDKGRFDNNAALRQAKNIIWACREAGVSEVVFSSVLNISRSASGVPWIDHKRLYENIFRNYFPQGVIVRPSLYLENLGTHLMEIQNNLIKGRFGADQKVPYVALKDIGKSVADIFRDPDFYRGKL